MKRYAALALLAFCLTGVRLNGQTPASGVKKTPEITMRKQVLPSPASIRPKPAARPSTSEAGPVHAGWKPLTELPSLALVDRNGQAAALPGPSGGTRHWFLLYRTATCVPCDRLMLALQASTSTELKAGKPYVVVVDSPDPAALERVHASFAGLSDATWTADRQRSVATTLKLHGSPVLVAMDGKRVAWRVAGNLDSTDTVVRMTNGWLAQNASEANQAPALSWSDAQKAAASQAASMGKPAAVPSTAKQ